MSCARAFAGLLAVFCLGSLASAQVVREVGDFPSDAFSSAVIDGSGQRAYAVSTADPYGTNPGHRNEIFSWDAATGVGGQVTAFEDGVLTVSVSDDGSWLAFVSNGDLMGGNHDESAEVFVMHPDGTGLAQITSDTSRTGYGVTAAVIAGSGNRVAFLSDTDPLGTNPARTPRVFVVDREGSNVVQIPDPPADSAPIWNRPAISDDGSRLVFVTYNSSQQLTRIYIAPSDGTAVPTLRATSPIVNVPALSGNGETLVFSDIDTVTFIQRISKMSWAGPDVPTRIVDGSQPFVADDGQTVVYRSRSGGTWKVAIDGTGAVLVKADAPPQYCSPLAIAGNGSRILAGVEHGPSVTGHTELFATDGSGGDVQQLTHLTLETGYIIDPRITTNANRIYFESERDLTGGNADRSYEIFTMQPDGTGLAQVTNIPSPYNYLEEYAVSDAGLVVFKAEGSLMPQNGCNQNSNQLYKINTNGTGLTQISTCTSGSVEHANPQITSNGQYIVYMGDDRVGSNVDGWLEVFRMTPSGTDVAPITNDNTREYKYPRIGSTLVGGTYWITYQSSSNADGMNPHGRSQIFRVTLLGSGLQRITADPDYASQSPDISADGTRIVWISSADFVGANPSHKRQVFLWDATMGTTRQLTSAAYGEVYGSPRITQDGTWVYFVSQKGLERALVATGVVEHVSGFAHATSGYPSAFDIDAGGSHAVFAGQDVIDRSPSAMSVFLADQTAKADIAVGSAAPTLVAWDPDPQSIRYDVIRGDVARLSIAGSTIDLGEVFCMEDDSPDNHTRGHEDATQPVPGQAFFYLYRGTSGPGAVAGSWGQGAGNRERVAGAGSCGP